MEHGGLKRELEGINVSVYQVSLWLNMEVEEGPQCAIQNSANVEFQSSALLLWLGDQDEAKRCGSQYSLAL